MTEIAAEAATGSSVAGDIKLVGLVSAAHSMSHFYQLVLPPIFPLLTAVFGVGYAELGIVTSLVYVASGLMQTPAGILVDRLGPTRVLLAGMTLFSGAVLMFGLVPGFWWLAPLAIVAGLGNSVFHPADYAIMTARVDAGRLGRAYGVHGLAGNLGWVAAPASMLALTAAFGWRAALVILGAAGLLLTLYLASQRAVLSGEPAAASRTTAAPSGTGREEARRVFLSPPILFCFAYFTLLSVSQVGLQTFLPSAAVAAFGVSIETANAMLTSFLLAASIGVVAGGIVADRFPRHELVIGLGLAISALLSLVFALASLPVAALTAVASLAGLAMGATNPARDMLVRGATPAGATGKVFGFVYSGLDLGAAVAPPFLGLLLDHHLPRLVFVAAAVALFIAIASAAVAGGDKRNTSRPRAGTATAPR
ncbi:MAG TPA: MFS transporter [Stellaceae bacterium]|jgi:MFS family permease|nr:MFS transporter [Stellaceae bacterium]